MKKKMFNVLAFLHSFCLFLRMNSFKEEGSYSFHYPHKVHTAIRTILYEFSFLNINTHYPWHSESICRNWVLLVTLNSCWGFAVRICVYLKWPEFLVI